MQGYAYKQETQNAGLTTKKAQEAAALHGTNRLSRQKSKSFLRRFLSNLNDPVIRILLCALAINLLLLLREGDWMETVGVGVAVFLAALISTLSEHSSQKAFEKLSEQEGQALCRIRRDGCVRELPVAEAVVGDVILLSAGEWIPADGHLICGDLLTDQSALTGEGREIRKKPSRNTSLDPNAPSSLFRGCTVTSGSGEMLVAAVGDATVIGQISREIQTEQRDSPLKIRLSVLARQISRIGYAAALLVALAYLFNVFVLDSGMRWEVIRLKLLDPAYLLAHSIHALTLGLTVLVVAVPEGLPMMIAVVLASNSRRMVRDQVLVRKPSGIEAAGSMNLLFTDKTGTLTEGNMRVASLLTEEASYKDLSDGLQKGSLPARHMALCFRYNNDAVIGRDESGASAAIGGSATERALLQEVIRLPIPEDTPLLSRLPFDSARKYSAVTIGGRERITLLLGAPEKLLPHATFALSEAGGLRPFSRRVWEEKLRTPAQSGCRVLTVALAREAVDATALQFGIHGSLILLGAVVLRDPLRREASDSVRTLQNAGIGVVMITGDHAETARAIASECGILSRERDLVLTGEELAHSTDQELLALLPRLAVVARALPSDKSRLVRLAQESGKVTGMTGDGVNDAPALRHADIGFAMGSGTQVAKDAGDILILDNNLASITRAVLYGRNIFKSIRKFITLQLTMNFCAVGVTMICPFLGIDSPVTVIQMLWINIIMDTLGGLAFAGEAPLPDCMQEKPKKRNEAILNPYMIHQITFLGGFTVLLFLFFLKSPLITSLFRHTEGNLCLLTAFFGLFIFASVLNCFNARTDRLHLLAGLRQNRVFIGIMVTILLIQLGFLYLGGSILRTMPLTPRELFLTMLLSLSVFPADLLRKEFWRLRGKRGGY
ncbi:MAG: calcium-translocating P-type ATPase, PMCA-type [Clostridia bacterium]|nr:calcium-translocating P-type ATPase, PMCA-type [Clostridia bacterium]